MASIAVPSGSSSSKPARASATASATTGGKQKDAVPSFGIMWTIMRSIGDISLPFFLSSLHISSAHLVPPSNTPLILCSNHSNTILDVAILASHFPERRPLHFWAKAGFFKNPITRFILTSSGNIKVDRRNKNNQALFEGTFEAMKVGGAIALFPEGGSYTIPKLADLKMGAAWAALEYSRYLQLQGEGQDGRQKTEVKILPAAVVFDDKSVFRSRAVLRFGQPISLDRYIAEFLSAPSPSDDATAEKKGPASGVEKEDGTVPATPESMTRSNTAAGQGNVDNHASPAHRAVARLTADLQRAMEELTFNAPDWETFQAVRMARELTFELAPGGKQVVKESMGEFVDISRALMTLLTLDNASTYSTGQYVKKNSKEARHSLFAYSSLLHLANVDNLTLARTSLEPTPLSSFLSPLKSLLLRLPLYVPLYGLTLIPTYILPNKLAHHFAAKEEESLSSAKTLFSFFLTTLLYGGLLVKTMQWTRWSPPGLLVGLAGVWWLHDLGKSNIDVAYGLVKQLRFGWRVYRANLDRQVSQTGTQGDKNMVEKEGKSLFFYGTLVHPKILARVIGKQGSHLRVQNAVLEGAKLLHVKGEEYPGLIQTSQTANLVDVVKGTLVSGLTDADLACLDAFEGDEYTRISVCVTPDPLSPVESNSTRVANAGSAPLHSILANLDKDRMVQLCRGGEGKTRAEVYSWTAGRDRLQDKVWEFDVFARDKAQNWVGEGEVEHEHEYQLVDRLHAETGVTSTSTITSSPPHPSTPTEAGGQGEWIETFSSSLTNDEKTRDAVERVGKFLAEKPSIQFYVNKAFPRKDGVKRPQLGDRNLLNTVMIARVRARDALQDLLRSVDSIQDGIVQEAIALLVGAKSRALGLIGEQMDATWPFTQTQVHTHSTRHSESRKTL